jgi:hypothetical protein
VAIYEAFNSNGVSVVVSESTSITPPAKTGLGASRSTFW